MREITLQTFLALIQTVVIAIISTSTETISHYMLVYIVAAFLVYFILSKNLKKKVSKRLHFALVRESIQHNHYYCTRSYSSFGGLRCLLFPHNKWNPLTYLLFEVTSETGSGETPTDLLHENNYYKYILQIIAVSYSIFDMDRQNSERSRSSNGSVSSKEAEQLISFLAFESSSHPSQQSQQITKNPMSSNHIGKQSTHSSDAGTLEPATLIYHESAHSIVFRDQVRRSFADTQHSQDETVVSAQTRNKKSDFKGSVRSTGTFSLSHKTNDDESLKSDGSGSKSSTSRRRKNRSFSRRRKNLKDSSSLADSQHSWSSIDTSKHNDDKVLEVNEGDNKPKKPQIIIANYTPVIEPLPAMELGAYNEFTEVLQSRPFIWNEGEGTDKAKTNKAVWDTMNENEKEVATMLLHQKCVVKTVKKADWTGFLQKFVVQDGLPRRYLHPAELKSCSKEVRYKKYSVHHEQTSHNSFMTSTSLLPSAGLKMRCFGSTNEYCLGVIFALPVDFPREENEDSCASASFTWSWPSGYAAKTEFNISPSGDLINGREEALVSISSLRVMNHSYVYDQDYEILGKLVKGGLKTVPYNEIYLRVGGCGCGKVQPHTFSNGVGLPIALFVRSAAYGDLIALLRTKRRMTNILGKDQVGNLPLFYITPDLGVRVITDALQTKLLQTMTNSLNPFQNPSVQYKTEINNTSEKHLQQKVEELFDLDSDNIRDILTPEECARLAGGFGATDDSVAHLLMDAMVEDFENETEKKISFHHLQDLVNEGLTSAVRSGDFNTSRQLLILYTLVASRGQQERERANSVLSTSTLDGIENSTEKLIDSPKCPIGGHKERLSRQFSACSSSVISERSLTQKIDVSSSQTTGVTKRPSILSPPPPPPLDTDRLRSATNSDGLLAVLGAAEVLKSMQNEVAKKRSLEAIEALEEWIEKSENSVSYRLAHWRDLTTAQGDLKIRVEERSDLWKFVSKQAINNR
jgi:hypothetical protein